MSNYPDTESRAYSFQRAELNCNRKNYTAISNVQSEQITEEEPVHGTAPYPLMRSEGQMPLGSGTITFSEEGERYAFIDDLGNHWRDKTWTLTWIKTAPGRPKLKFVAYGCRVLGEPQDDESGSSALTGDIQFSFMYFTINGKVPHGGLPAPTQ